MTGQSEDVRREGDFPVIVSGASDPRDEHDTNADGPEGKPGPSPGLPPHGSDVSGGPIPGSDVSPSPTRLPGDPAPLDDRPLHSEDPPLQVP